MTLKPLHALPPDPHRGAKNRALIEGMFDDLLLFTGYDDCLIGTAEHWGAEGHTTVALYDRTLLVEKLMGDGLSEEEAHEHISHNMTGAYVGRSTPVVADLFPQEGTP